MTGCIFISVGMSASLCAYGGRTAGHAGARAENSRSYYHTHTHTYTLMYTLQQGNNDPILTQQPKTERGSRAHNGRSHYRGGWWWGARRMGDGGGEGRL